MTSRRKFIKHSLVGAGVAAAIPTILPSCVKWKGANDRLYVGHVGVGSRGTAELKHYFQPHDIFRNVAVCDVFKSRREAASQLIKADYSSKGIDNPSCEDYLDYRELLDRKDIDVVAITTSDHWHLPIAIHAAQAGKHVHVNKPLGLSYDYMQRLKMELDSKKLNFNYGTQQRSYAFIQKAVEHIQSGDLGEIKEVLVWAPGGGLDRHIAYFKPQEVPADLDYNRWLGPAPEAPYTADRVHRDGSFFINDYSIGFLGGWGAHPLDVLVMAMKEKMRGDILVSGKGEIRWPAESMYNNVNVWDTHLKFNSGFQVHFLSQDLAKPLAMNWQSAYRQNGTLFIGTKGWISLSRTYAESDIPEINKSINAFPKKEWGLDGDRGLHVVNFAKLIQGELDHYMEVDDAILSDLISHLANISVRLKRSVKWDGPSQTISTDQQANELLNRNHRTEFAIS